MSRTAEILPFPEKPEGRLRRALQALDLALVEQSAAVAGLRQELGALSAAVEELGSSLQTCSGVLAETQEAVLGTHAEARRLEATADAMIAACQA